MATVNHDEYYGAMSAIFTPYDKTGAVNLDMLEKIVNFQLDAGLTGFYVTGSTGEGFLLTDAERRSVIEHVVKFTAGRGKVIAHVGHISTDQAVDLAKFAAKVGVDMNSSVGPVYYGQSFEAAYRHYGAIAAATDLPFMIYALGVKLVPERDVKFFDLPNIVGMKYTGMDFYSVQQLVRLLDKRIVLFSGFDEQSVMTPTFGFDGSIGTTQNAAPKQFADIYALQREGKMDEAMKIQAKVNEVIYLMNSSENRSYQKNLMRYVGYDCGNFRAPYAPLTEAEYQAFATTLDAIGILSRND